jgi:hypothetical protein
MKTKNETGVYNAQIAVKSKADQMKSQLEAQEQISVLIPLEKGEKKGAKQSFIINGYRVDYPKGKFIKVPEQIAQMISDRYEIELEVRGKSLDYADETVKTALN